MLADRGMTREEIENCTIEWVATVIFAPRDKKDGQLMLYKKSQKTTGTGSKKPAITDPVDLYRELCLARGFPKQKVLEYLEKVKAERDRLLKEAGL